MVAESICPCLACRRRATPRRVARPPTPSMGDGLDHGRGPGDLLGHTHCGAINGAKALAPVAAAALWSPAGDPSLMLWTMLGSVLVGTVGFGIALTGAAR